MMLVEGLSEVNAANWQQEVASSSKLIAVYFWHNRCPWCYRFTPIVEEAKLEYADQMKVVKLNILGNPVNREIATGYGVMSTPSIVFFCHGRAVGQVVGAMPKEQLEKVFDGMLGRYKQCLMQSTELKPAYIV
jgi:thioredoxin 1